VRAYCECFFPFMRGPPMRAGCPCREPQTNLLMDPLLTNITPLSARLTTSAARPCGRKTCGQPPWRRPLLLMALVGGIIFLIAAASFRSRAKSRRKPRSWRLLPARKESPPPHDASMQAVIPEAARIRKKSSNACTSWKESRADLHRTPERVKSHANMPGRTPWVVNSNRNHLFFRGRQSQPRTNL